MLDDTETSPTFLTNEDIRASYKQSSQEMDEKTSSRKTVDFVLQGKGGAGKTLIASFLAQYGQDVGKDVRCYDCDPINNTLASVETLCTEVIDILVDEETNVPEMDRMISEMLSIDSNFVVDAGASGFVPTLSYLLREELFDLISQSGKVVRVHVVIIGGESFADTVLALRDMVQQLPKCVQIVVWMNEFFGPLSDGNCYFEESTLWNKDLFGICYGIKLPKMHKSELETFRKLTSMHKTFAQAQTDSAFNPVERLRLRRIWKPIRDQIEASRNGI